MRYTILGLVTVLGCFLVSVDSLAGSRVVAAPAAAGSSLGAGDILILGRERALYFLLGDGQAVRYPVAVGKAGKEWSGTAHVDGKYVRPAWAPPAEVKRDNPRLPNVIAGGAPSNPMGAAALTLDNGEYAIHGTSASMRKSIGTAASYGCIRMLNEDILDLFPRVEVGATVFMIP